MRLAAMLVVMREKLGCDEAFLTGTAPVLRLATDQLQQADASLRLFFATGAWPVLPLPVKVHLWWRFQYGIDAMIHAHAEWKRRTTLESAMPRWLESLLIENWHSEGEEWFLNHGLSSVSLTSDAFAQMKKRS